MKRIRILGFGVAGVLLLAGCSQGVGVRQEGEGVESRITEAESNQTRLSEIPLEFEAECGYTVPIGQGPYYVSGAPVLTDGDLNYANFPGDTLVLSGFVLEGIEEPVPVANAELDFWQTDAEGNYWPLGAGSVDDYSAEEVALRGVVKTDSSGFYEVKTILPEEYSGRPRHMHVKVRAPGKAELTSQLYWQLEGDENPVTNSDVSAAAYDCQVLSATQETENTYSSRYDFYLR